MGPHLGGQPDGRAAARLLAPPARLRWLAVSDTARQVLATTLALDPDDVAVVHNPVDPAEVVGRRSPRDRVAVGFLGLGTRAKGFCLLPEIVREVGPATVGWQVFTNEPDARHLPDERRAWRELTALSATHDVALRGRVRDVRRAYADCDVVLCPSHHEAFPMVAAEAMANGIPVVATDIPAYRDLVGAAGAGLLFPVDDAAAAATAIATLAGDPPRRRSLGARGREAVRRYAPERIVPQLGEAYRDAARRAR